MNAETRQALRAAAAAVIARWNAVDRPVTTALRPVIKREQNGWRMERESFSRPNLDLLPIEDLSQAFGALLAQHHPEHLGQISSEVGHSTAVTAGTWVRAVVEVTCRAPDFDLAEGHLDQAVDAIESIIDGADYEVRFIVPLFRFSMEEQNIVLNDGVVLRQMTDEELAQFSTLLDAGIGFPSCCISGCARLKKVFEAPPGEPTFIVTLFNRLDRLLLALRTIRAGAVAYGFLFIEPTNVNPVAPRFGMGRPPQLAPLPHYRLGAADAGVVIKRDESLKKVHPTLRVAASRLSSASIRTDARDRIIDAVIGLEALLLADTGDEKYRGELRFRFSVNYALLCDDKATREQAFLAARTMYDLRSAIAHGSSAEGQKTKVGGVELTDAQCAEKVTEMLRSVFDRFLESPLSPDCCDFTFWRKKYFGVD